MRRDVLHQPPDVSCEPCATTPSDSTPRVLRTHPQSTEACLPPSQIRDSRYGTLLAGRAEPTHAASGEIQLGATSCSTQSRQCTILPQLPGGIFARGYNSNNLKVCVAPCRARPDIKFRFLSNEMNLLNGCQGYSFKAPPSSECCDIKLSLSM
jgi:hypothetical protein